MLFQYIYFIFDLIILKKILNAQQTFTLLYAEEVFKYTSPIYPMLKNRVI